VIETRQPPHALPPFDAAFRTDLWNHAQSAGRSWKESLRYHANKPYDQELDDVAAAARWLKQNYRRLWN
jgi:hypothetical protein